MRLPLEAIRELQVVTSQFGAEFSRTTGAVVNAITRQGTNAFHGSAFAFVQDASLTQRDFFARQNALAKPDTTFQQYGFTLGGPIVKDKAHFFASVERVVIDDARTINIPSRRPPTPAPGFGVQYEYVTAEVDVHGNLNGTFVFRGNDPFNPADPRTYPERLNIRVPGPSILSMKAHHLGAFSQDKWKVGRRLTLSLGLRYDLEVIPFREQDNPRFPDPSDYPVDRNNLSPRVGFAFDRGATAGSSSAAATAGPSTRPTSSSSPPSSPRRLLGLVRGDLPDQQRRSRTLAGPAALGSAPGQRPHRRSRALSPSASRPARGCEHGHRRPRRPGPRVPYTDQPLPWVRAGAHGTLSVSVDYVHAFGRDQFIARDLNPGVRVAPHGRTVVRLDPTFVSPVYTGVEPLPTDYDALSSVVDRCSSTYRLRSPTRSRGRGNTSGSSRPTAHPRASEPFQYQDDMRLDLNEGPTDFDRPHNLVLGGSVVAPRTGGLTASTVVRDLSGTALHHPGHHVDTDRNGLLFDPLPTGNYSGIGPNSFTVATTAAATAAGGRTSSRPTRASGIVSPSAGGTSTVR